LSIDIMDKDTAISLSNITKTYKLYSSHSDRVKEAFHPIRKKYHHPFHALSDISLKIKKGDTIGIIGQNGSGKSTLLQIICGILQPTTGCVEVDGKISALLELGAGFNPEFTGLQNIYLSGSIMGFTRQEMDEKLDDIIGFADIGDYITQPVKTYSSGMYVRLAFSVATAVEPEILIVDEALSVGDMFFQAKCIERIKRMISSNDITFIFVSHDLGSIKSLCEKSVLLDRGQVAFFGKSEVAVEEYFGLKVQSEQVINDKTSIPLKKVEIAESPISRRVLSLFSPAPDFLQRISFQRIQNGKASFVNIVLLDENENEVRSVQYGQDITLRMAIAIHEDIPVLVFGYHIRNKNGVDIIYSDSPLEDRDLLSPQKGEHYIIDWRFKAELIQGDYNIACVLSEPVDLTIGRVIFCDYTPYAYQFQMEIRSPTPIYGSVHWNNSVDITKVNVS